MARQARVKSDLGIYLINLKSVDNVCFSYQDKIDYLDILLFNKVVIYGYTLLDNSFNFIIKEDKKAIDVILRQNSIAFVKKYNKKHNRQGKVFAGRYVSYPANNLDEVWNFIKSVHKMTSIDKNSISSKKDYFNNKYIDSCFALNQFKNQEDFFKFCNDGSSEIELKLNDEEIKNYIINTYKIQPHNIAKMPQTFVERLLFDVFNVTKASARQIARITSLPLRFLWGIGKKFKDNIISTKSKNIGKNNDDK